MRSARLCFTALALALTSTAAVAETQVGVIAGANFANLNIEGANGLSTRSTLAAGGAVDLSINPRFGVRVEPMFVSKGAKATHRNAYWGSVDGAVFKLDYVDVPVLARFDLATSPKRGYLLAGLGVGFAVQREVELSAATAHETVDFSDIFKSTDLSLDLGAGFGLPVASNRMTFDGRVAIGLVNINDGGTVSLGGIALPVPPTSTHTLDFRLFATYLFALSGK